MDGGSRRGRVLAAHIMREVVICASTCSQGGKGASREEKGDKKKRKRGGGGGEKHEGKAVVNERRMQAPFSHTTESLSLSLPLSYTHTQAYTLMHTLLPPAQLQIALH